MGPWMRRLAVATGAAALLASATTFVPASAASRGQIRIEPGGRVVQSYPAIPNFRPPTPVFLNALSLIHI